MDSSSRPRLVDGPGRCCSRPCRVGRSTGPRRHGRVARNGPGSVKPQRCRRHRRHPVACRRLWCACRHRPAPACSSSTAGACTSCSGPAGGFSRRPRCSSPPVRSCRAFPSRRCWYGVSQFLGIVSALFFVISSDAYPARPRVRRGYALVLMAVLFWFALAPMALDWWTVFAPRGTSSSPAHSRLPASGTSSSSARSACSAPPSSGSRFSSLPVRTRGS